MNEQENKEAVAQPGSALQVIHKSGEAVKTVIGDNAATLNDILMDNIKKLRDDPSPEALSRSKEIRENVRGIVDIAKTQIEMFRVTKG
jgi:hypothetical protein